MSRHVDYYFAPQSPWTYLGHQRFAQIVGAAKATLRVLPVDLGRIFPLSGGLPLGQARAAAPGLPPGRSQALFRAPESAAEPASPVLSGERRRCGPPDHRRRPARRHRRGHGAHRRRAAARCGRRSATSPTRRCWRNCWPSAACPAARLDEARSPAVRRALPGPHPGGDRRRGVRRAHLCRSTVNCSGARTVSISCNNAFRS